MSERDGLGDRLIEARLERIEDELDIDPDAAPDDDPAEIADVWVHAWDDQTDEAHTYSVFVPFGEFAHHLDTNSLSSHTLGRFPHGRCEHARGPATEHLTAKVGIDRAEVIPAIEVPPPMEGSDE